MAINVEGNYDSSTLGATILVRLRAAEGAAYVPGTGTAEFALHAFNGASRRRFGIHARGATLRRVIGDGEASRVVRSFLPYGTQAALDSLAINSTVTIGGNTWTVASKVPESSV